MDEMIQNVSYAEYKRELDAELQKSAESFVKIGYLLKVARDTNVLAESGYKSVTEFAQAEYNIDKTQVSRFIHINDRFSENGYSDHLLPNYQGFGYAKLTLMLQIPEEITDELSPTLSKTDIQAIKEEVAEEQKVTDIEIAIEGVPEEIKAMSMLEMAINQLAENEPALLAKMKRAYDGSGLNENNVKEMMAPNEDSVYSVRVQGMGRLMITCTKDTVCVTPVRAPEEKEPCDWMEVTEAWSLICMSHTETQEIAPVQQEKPQKVYVAPKVDEKQKKEKGTPKRDLEEQKRDLEEPKEDFMPAPEVEKVTGEVEEIAETLNAEPILKPGSRVYISGPVTGTQDAEERFKEAAEQIAKLGYIPFDPVAGIHLPECCSHADWMKVDIAMLSLCDGIYMMSGWGWSEGAKEEYEYAQKHGIKEVKI